MEYGEFKPLLTALAMPPAGPLLLALLGLLLARRALGKLLLLLGLASAWLLSCSAVAVLLAQALLPRVPPIQAADLNTGQVQAIVVLGGGVLPHAPEYGQAQPSAHTLARLRYAVWLARQTGKPLAFSSGIGWAAAPGTASEADVAQQVLKQDYGLVLRWAEGGSRDTQENALQMRQLLQRDKIDRIALVTDAWHMPRAVFEFERSGFQVTAAPTGYIAARERPLLEWLPSAHGVSSSRQVLREWLGLQIARR